MFSNKINIEENLPVIVFLISALVAEDTITKPSITNILNYTSVGIMVALLGLQSFSVVSELESKYKKGFLYGFIAAIICMIFLKRYINSSVGRTKFILTCLPLLIVFLVEGLLIGVQLEKYTLYFGFLTILMVCINNLLIGYNLGTSLQNQKNSKLTNYTIIGILTLAVPFGCFCGKYFFKNTNWVYFGFAFGLVTMIWDIFEQKIPEAYQSIKTLKESSLTSFTFFIGIFLVTMINWYSKN